MRTMYEEVGYMSKVRFLWVGGVVFLCDGVIFYGLAFLGLKIEFARAFALIITVQLTFIGHRVLALNVANGLNLRIAWLRHQLASGLGAFINYSLFSVIFYFSDSQNLAFIAAVLCTTLVNFMLAAYWVHNT